MVLFFVFCFLFLCVCVCVCVCVFIKFYFMILYYVKRCYGEFCETYSEFWHNGLVGCEFLLIRLKFCEIIL